MVSQTYLEEKPSGPGPMKRALDRLVLPAAINTLYRGEMVLETVLERAQRAPVTALLAAMGCGYLLRVLTRRSRPRSYAATASRAV